MVAPKQGSTEGPWSALQAKEREPAGTSQSTPERPFSYASVATREPRADGKEGEREVKRERWIAVRGYRGRIMGSYWGKE